MHRNRILIAEDDILVRRLIKRLLEREGYCVIPAATGGACLEKARKFKPSLIILDLHLPGLNGFEVLRKLQAAKWGERIPVLCITGVLDPKNLLGSAAYGMRAAGFVRKPFHNRRLVDKVRRLVEPHAHRLSRREPTRDGKGSTLRPHAKNVPRTPAKAPSKLVLIADDDPQFLDLLKTACESRGYRVETASTGKDALNKIIESRPDLVVLDLRLPDTDGLQVCGQLKLDASTRAIPAVIVTAHGRRESWFDSIRSGADVFLSKPIVWEDFFQCLDALLHRLPYKAADGGKIKVGCFDIDPKEHLIILNGRPIRHVTTKPFDLAYLLVQHRSRALDRREILSRLGIPTVRDNEVNVLMHHLRKDIGTLGEELFKAAHGQGYYFDEAAAIRLDKMAAYLPGASSRTAALRDPG